MMLCWEIHRKWRVFDTRLHALMRFEETRRATEVIASIRASLTRQIQHRSASGVDTVYLLLVALEEGTRLLGEHSLPGDPFQILLWKNAFDDRQKSLDQHPHVVEIALLHAPPNAGSVSHDDRECI